MGYVGSDAGLAEGLAAVLAYDLKTPLTVALVNADLLAEIAASGTLGADQAACAQRSTWWEASATMRAGAGCRSRSPMMPACGSSLSPSRAYPGRLNAV